MALNFTNEALEQVNKAEEAFSKDWAWGLIWFKLALAAIYALLAIAQEIREK